MRFNTTLVQFLGLAVLAPMILVTTAHADGPEVATYTKAKYTRAFATGLVRTHQSEDFLRTAPRASFTDQVGNVPGTYTVRSHAGPVEDQGQCGSCWDFSLTSVLRGTLMMSGKDPGRLSFNYLLNCAQAPQSGCEGGDFAAADYFVSPAGAPAYGSDGAYTGAAGKCVQQPVVASVPSYKLLGTNLGSNPKGAPPSFKDIAYVVGVLHQPVSIDVAADMNWQYYRSGIYNGCSDEKDEDVNHMVVIEGYSCETSVDSSGNCVFGNDGNLPAGVGTYTIRNSWGTVWGDKGYITTKATDKNGKRCNAVATDALYYDVK
jgi:C1A family cysteine protease